MESFIFVVKGFWRMLKKSITSSHSAQTSKVPIFYAYLDFFSKNRQFLSSVWVQVPSEYINHGGKVFR